MTTQANAPAIHEEHTSRRVLVVMISVMLGILLAALDQTVVGPALPKIIGDLNGFDHYTWVLTAYLLTSTISVPIFGKLSDMYGRKWFYVAGITIFLIGSALSGVSGDIFQLIGFRGLQGLGAGIIMAIAFAIVADLIPPAERGKWQGAFGGVWGLASVVGPTVGGYLTDNLSWRWVFYVNIPVGIIALAVLIAAFPHTPVAHARKIIDWLGVGTLTAGLTPLLLALSLGGTSGWAWDSTRVLGLFGAAAFFLIAFIFVESRAKEPIIPLDLFKDRIFTASAVTVFVAGVGLFGAVLYIPLFIQAIQGGSATSSGNAITPMTIAVVISSIITGQLISRTGKYRIIGIVGMGLMTVGMFLLYTMTMDTSRLVTIAFMIVVGLGMGVTMPLYTLVVQNAFPIERVGVVTATVQFARSIGGAVGVALLGSVVNNQFAQHFRPELTSRLTTAMANIPAGAATPAAGRSLSPTAFANALSGLNPQVLVSDQGVQQLHSQLVNTYHVPAAFAGQLITLIQAAMKPALFAGIQEAFLIGAFLLGIGLISTVFLKEIPLRRTNRGPAMAPAEGSHGREGVEKRVREAGREMAAGELAAIPVPAEDEPRFYWRDKR